MRQGGRSTPAPEDLRQPTGTVFTVWAWLTLAPYLLTAFGGYDLAKNNFERLAGVTAAVVAYLVVGLGFLIGWAVERQMLRLPHGAIIRWLWFAIMLAAVSLARPYVVSQVQSWFGVDLISETTLNRSLLNAIGIGFVCILLFLFLERARRAASARRALRDVIRGLAAHRAELEAATDALPSQFEQDVAAPVRDALRAVDPRSSNADMSARLRDIAHDVARPLTSAMFEMNESAVEYRWVAPTPAPRRHREDLGLPRRIEAANPWVPALIWLLLELPIAIATLGVQIGIVLDLASTIVVLAINWLLTFIPLPRRPIFATICVFIGYAGIGALARSIVIAGAPEGHDLAPGWFYGVGAYAVMATIVALSTSANRDFLSEERTLTTEVIRAAQETSRASLDHSLLVNRLARVSHASVQGDIVATSLKLKFGGSASSTLAALIARVDWLLANAPKRVDEIEPEAPDAERDAMLGILSAWRPVLDLEIDIRDDIWPWMARHPERAALIRSAVTEALCNVLRLAPERTAKLSIELAPTGIAIEVRSPGRLDSRRWSFNRQTREVVDDVEFVQDGPEVAQRVTVGPGALIDT